MTSSFLYKVALNSIGGLRPFARASRLCRALSRPYSFEIPKVSFNELDDNIVKQRCTPVSLRETENFKTLEIIRPSYSFDQLPHSGALEALRPIQSVLSNQNSYTHVRYLVESDPFRTCSAAALKRILHACPTVSQLTLVLPNVQEYCFEDGSAGYRGPKGAALVAVISRFTNLDRLELRFTIHKPNLHLLYPAMGTHLAEDIFTRVQDQKLGARLSRLDLVLSTLSTTLFGRCDRTVPPSRANIPLSVTMSCFLPSSQSHPPTSTSDSKVPVISPASTPTPTTPHPTPTLHCDLPIYGTILDRKAQTDRLIGPHDLIYGSHHHRSRRCCTPVSWEWEAGPRTWQYVQKEWPHPSEASMFYAKVRTAPLMWAWYCMRRSTRRRAMRRLLLHRE